MDADSNNPVELLDDLIGEAADIHVSIADDGFEYSREGVIFAARSAASVVEVRLGEEIAEAARRTPDTTASGRGPAWIRFAPHEWDDHALDRLEAWFRVAWRTAETSR